MAKICKPYYDKQEKHHRFVTQRVLFDHIRTLEGNDAGTMIMFVHKDVPVLTVYAFPELFENKSRAVEAVRLSMGATATLSFRQSHRNLLPERHKSIWPWFKPQPTDDLDVAQFLADDPRARFSNVPHKYSTTHLHKSPFPPKPSGLWSTLATRVRRRLAREAASNVEEQATSNTIQARRPTRSLHVYQYDGTGEVRVISQVSKLQ